MNPPSKKDNKLESGGKPIDSNDPVDLEEFVALEEQRILEDEARDKTYRISAETGKEDTGYSAAKKDLFEATTARILAISIWIIIGIIVIVHIGSVAWLWSHLPSLIDSTNDAVEQLENAVEQIERASKSIDEIAKTLYTFLGTLATAITGYYFKESAARKRDNPAD